MDMVETVDKLDRLAYDRFMDGDPLRFRTGQTASLHVVSFKPSVIELYSGILSRGPWFSGALAVRGFLLAEQPRSPSVDALYTIAQVGDEGYGFQLGLPFIQKLADELEAGVRFGTVTHRS
jgi:hypothetical protein